MYISIYTDGSSRGNPGPGGYGYILISGEHKKEGSKGFRLTTNNRMELLSVIEAIEALKGLGHEVHIYSDSKYVVDAIEKGWLKGWVQKGFAKVKNPDLWRRFYAIQNNHKLRFHWIKGHNDHPENERCDKLAVAAALGSNLGTDHGYEESQRNGGLL